MVDTNPTDHTAHSASPAARLATRDELYGTDAPSGITDQDQIDAVLGFSPDAPAAPLSADEIAEMRRILNAATPGDWYRNGEYVRDATAGDALLCLLNGRFEDVTFAASAKASMRRLLSALEALTAERDRLRDALNQTVQEACAAIDDELKPEIARLTAENDRLTDKVGLAKILLAMQAYCPDREFYDAPRRRVEAAHAAAKQAKADRLWTAPMEEVIAAILPALAAQATKADAGIDMELLGELCREEPDEAAKREVDEMMDRLNGGS